MDAAVLCNIVVLSAAKVFGALSATAVAKVRDEASKELSFISLRCYARL